MILRGVFPVLCTPFRPDGAVDGEAFDRVVEFVLACGAKGCVFPGMASEVETLTPEERAALVARLGARLGGRVPFIVGASAASAGDSCARIAEGAAAGAVCAMVMAPPQAGRDVAAQVAHFTAIGAASALPLMLQNAPPPNGAGLAPEAVAEIARAVPAIAYVKEETLPCGQNLTRIRAAAGEAILGVFGGAGARYVTDELARGALGTMPAVELADLHVRLVAAWAAGEVSEARRLFESALPLLNLQAVFRVHLTKAVLARRGVLSHTGARAAGPVPDAGDRAEIDALLDRIAPELSIYPLAARTAAE